MSKYNSIIDISSDEDITFDLKNDECKEKSKQKKLNDFFDFSPERKITVPDTDSSNSPKNNSYQDDGWEKKFMPISPENKKTSPKDELDHSILNMDFYDSANRDQTLQIISNSPNKKDIIKTEDKSLDNLRTLVHNKLGINIEGSDESDILLSKIKDIVEIFDSTRKSKAELEGNMNNLKKMYIEILEFYASFLDKVPFKVLCELPGFNENLFKSAELLKHKLKLELNLLQSKINNLEQDKRSATCDKEFLGNSNTLSNKEKNKEGHLECSASLKSQSSNIDLMVEKSIINKNIINDSLDSSSITCDKNSDKSNHKVFKFKSPAIKSRSKIIYDMINDIDQTQINRTTTTEITSTDEPFETDEQEEKQTNYNMLRSNSLVSSGVEKNSSTRSQFTNENNLNYEQAPEKKSQFTFKSSSNIIETKKTENHSKSEDVFNLYDENETEIIGNVFDAELDDDGWQTYNPKDFEFENQCKPRKSSPKQITEFSPKKSSPKQITEFSNKSNAQISRNNEDQKNGLGKFRQGIRNDACTGEFDNNYDHTKEMMIAFKEIFGLKSFRTNQKQVINAVLLGHDCFVLMPTGGGKSLCYQLPALLKQGVTVVISPLKSLILDQVNKMDTLDIPADHMSGDVSIEHCNRIYDDMKSSDPKIKLLYITPEKIVSSNKLQDALQSLYQRGLLAKFVIDEAHCVSQWGHDFRPDYKKLSLLRTKYPKAPTMALTATATPRVRQDVVNQLKLRDCRWFLCSFNRPNLKYIVTPKKSGPTMIKDIETLIKSKYRNASGIVYCLSRNDCDDMAKKLSATGIKAASYHAGMTDKLRESVQKSWLTNKFNVICATIAFGMGIDKPDVRFVIHASLPKSIEGYYQESGRAGRDGEVATCILYYNYSDMQRYRKMMDKDSSQTFETKQIHLNNLKRMVGYCENMTDCRRAQQLEYFAEIFDAKECATSTLTVCDNCESRGQYKVINVTEDCIEVVKAVRNLCSGKSRFTLLHMSEIFKGSSNKKILDFKHDKCALYGRGSSWARADILRLFHKMVIEEYLSEEIIFYNDIPNVYIKLGPKADQLRSGIEIQLSIKCQQKKSASVAKVSTSQATTESEIKLKNLSDRCYSDLLDVCRTIASEKNITMASVINMQALKIMSERLPETEADMMNIPHVTRANFDKFGQRFLEVTLKYTAEKLCMILDMEDAQENAQGEDILEENSDDSDHWASSSNSTSKPFTNNWRGKRKSSGSFSTNKRFKRGSKRSQPSRGRGKGRGRGRGSASQSSSSPKGKSASNKPPGFLFLSAPSSFKL